MTERPAGILDGLDRLGQEVETWHRANFTVNTLDSPPLAAGLVIGLGIGKVAEEAGEFFGAVVKLVEGRPGITRDELVEGRPGITRDELVERAYAELGDVVIAAAGGALRRLNELTGESRTFGDVVLARWADVAQRTYR